MWRPLIIITITRNSVFLLSNSVRNCTSQLDFHIKICWENNRIFYRVNRQRGSRPVRHFAANPQRRNGQYDIVEWTFHEVRRQRNSIPDYLTAHSDHYHYDHHDTGADHDHHHDHHYNSSSSTGTSSSRIWAGAKPLSRFCR